MAAPRPPCAWQYTGNPQLMNSPGGKGEYECRKNPGAGICSSGSRVCNQVRVLSEALLAHGVGNLLEAGDVCTLDVVNVSVRALAFLDAVVVDVLHDDMKLLIDLFC